MLRTLQDIDTGHDRILGSILLVDVQDAMISMQEDQALSGEQHQGKLRIPDTLGALQR